MAVKFEWSSKYAGIDNAIDKQHEYLFALGNELLQSSLPEKRAIILKLYRYTLNHFSDEENHMAAMNFPLLKEHKQIHEDLISSLNKITENGLTAENNDESLEIFFFRWICKHIMVEDKKYADFSKTV